MYTVRAFEAGQDAAAVSALTPYPWSWLEHKDAVAADLATDTAGCVVALGLWADGAALSPPRAGVCEAFVFVAAPHRRRGLGGKLLARAGAWARGQGLNTLSVGFTATEGDDSGPAFLERHGFIRRDSPSVFSHADLTAFDPAAFADRITTVRERYGVRFLTLAEAGAAEHNWRRLYDLEVVTRHDLPEGSGGLRPYDDWRAYLATFDDFAGTTLLAAVGDAWIGTTGIASHRYTGVLREWRGRGIATALKAEALARAKVRGLTRLDTHNHRDNAAMLAVNRRLGYVLDPPWLSFTKPLS
jgi:GNAT superfamily N-acetyltransferase